ncbi:T9SS type A sorting domain-containing protein [Rufibacter ruber]|uniref:T9SS type A sorting domain-containing protein n=1 Tax=Rufibacter ruber TaxID=1783499 RepID=UPI00082F9A4A|nr:T9SS type A sorting domain-containing protein [Rufibacter ruber]
MKILSLFKNQKKTGAWLLLLLLLLTKLLPAALAQTVVTKQWDKLYGGSGIEAFRSVVATNDGGFLLGGYSKSGISGDKTMVPRGESDFWVVRVNADGNKLWDRSYGGSNIDELTSMLATQDGGFLLGGYSRSTISGDKTEAPWGWDYDYWVVRIDANGDKLWDRRFGGSNVDQLTSMVAASDGGFLLGGHSRSLSGGDKTEAPRGEADFWAVRIDASGNKVWDRRFGGNLYEALTSVVATQDGGFLLGGYLLPGSGGDISESPKGGNDFWAVRIDAAGNKVWDRRLGGSGQDELTAMLATQDGGFLLGGHTRSGKDGDVTETLRGGADFWVVKVDAAGSKLWDRRYGGKGYDFIFSMESTQDGGFLLGGHSDSGADGDKTEESRGGIDFWVVRINADGHKLWDKRYGGSGDDLLFSVAGTQDSGFLLGGELRTGLGGDISETSRGGQDYWALRIKSSLATGVKESEMAKQLLLYPNPVTGLLRISLPLPRQKEVELRLLDAQGREVLRESQAQQTGKFEATLQLKSLPAGVYLLQLVTDQEVISKRIVKE